MNKRNRNILLWLLCGAAVSASLAACSGGAAQTAAGPDAESGPAVSYDESSVTEIAGKVTAVVGNEVTLAVGTLNRGQGGKTGGAASAASGASSSSGSSGGLIALTGETKTVQIPVGLSLSEGSAGGRGFRGQAPSGGEAPAESAAGGMPGGAPGEGQTASGGRFSQNGQRQGGFGSRPGNRGAVSSVASDSSGAGLAAAAKKKSDFSSITPGMVLQIEEATLSDGTTAIVRVSVLSE